MHSPCSSVSVEHNSSNGVSMSSGSLPWYTSVTLVNGIFLVEPLSSMTKCFNRLSSEHVQVRSCPSGDTTPICLPRTIDLTNAFIACWMRVASRCLAGMRSLINSLARLLDVPKDFVELATLTTLIVSVSMSTPLPFAGDGDIELDGAWLLLLPAPDAVVATGSAGLLSRSAARLPSPMPPAIACNDDFGTPDELFFCKGADAH
mmetsp:Transcript_95630/g.270616  ORF Transcript_95630/g.270616 Transcript_95630/m.270616 type:complete len:204 (+) Transcript_95630:151-762(+)